MPDKSCKWVLSPAFKEQELEVWHLLKQFEGAGNILLNSRNTIKSFETGNRAYNIKSFKPPHFINKIVYRFFRKSKARRSYEHAQLLLTHHIGTPAPVAFVEYFDAIGLAKSYYISEQVQDSFVMTDVIHSPNFPDKEKIISLYTQFHFKLHQAGILFLDNTQGNTLIAKRGDEYRLYLVDLNRMLTGRQLTLQQRMYNFARLTRSTFIMKQIAVDYARLCGADAAMLENVLLTASQKKFARLDNKKKWKKRLKHLFKKKS